MFIFSLGKIVQSFHVRKIFHALIMESSIIVFTWERWFMFFMCVRLIILLIRESMVTVFTKEIVYAF